MKKIILTYRCGVGGETQSVIGERLGVDLPPGWRETIVKAKRSDQHGYERVSVFVCAQHASAAANT